MDEGKPHLQPMHRSWLPIFTLACSSILFGQAAPGSGNVAGSLPALEPLAVPAGTPAAPAAPSNDRPPAPTLAVFPRSLLDPDSDPMAKLRAASLLPETRTRAQLEAILQGYVGHWQGQVNMRLVGLDRLITFPIEMTYSMEQQNGRKVLLCTTKYTFNGSPVAEQQRTWIENGRLVAEATGNGKTRRFNIYTRGDGLVWTLDDPRRSPLDFYHTETIKLTADGGRLLMSDFEATPSQNGTVLLSQMSELKLVK